MTIEDKIYLRKLAIIARNIYIEQFELEDDDYVDYRAVRGKERALANRIKKISKITGVAEDKIYKVVCNYSLLPLSSYQKYYDALRDIGIPIATLEDIQEFRKKVECDI